MLRQLVREGASVALLSFLLVLLYAAAGLPNRPRPDRAVDPPDAAGAFVAPDGDSKASIVGDHAFAGSHSPVQRPRGVRLRPSW